MPAKYEQIKNKFLSGDNEGCLSYFEKHGYVLESAYCSLIEENFDKAEKYFKQISEQDPRAHWGLVLVQMLCGDVTLNPTYFEIRNFLEIDLNLMIKYYKGDFVENIIRYSDFMEYFNPESYKFIGRVFWANNMLPAALFFLRRAKDRFYNDPELHYLLGYIAYEQGDTEQSKKALQACLNILPTYAPALKLMQKIQV